MSQIPVYKIEIQDGVSEAIRAYGSIIHSSEIKSWKPDLKDVEQEKVVASLKKSVPMRAASSLEDFDLHFLQTVLVTSGWNKNDDVFDQLEIWVARHTPAHKPFNYEHDCSHIIGHIISNWGMDEEGKIIAETSAVDELPNKFHLCTGSVLYKFWEKPELQERMDNVLAEIAKGEWFVSMECLFKGFDYSLKATDGSMKIVARNENTAFLTKHLRAYGGTGNYGQYKVGRLLRNIVFSGKGLVRKPANPESIIFTDTTPFSAKSNIITNFSQISAEQVYVDVAKQNLENEQVRNLNMAVENEVEKLKTEIEQLKASLRDNDVKDIKARADKAEGELVKANELLKDAEKAIATVKADKEVIVKEVEAVKAKLAEAEKSVAEQAGEIKSLHADKTKATRIASVKEKLGLDEAEATEFVSENESLSDEQFGKQIDLIVKTVAKKAPKSTPAKEQPKSTPAPLAPVIKASEEVDEKGEKTVEESDLEKAEQEKNATLSTAAESGVNDVQKAIAEYFNVEDDSEAK